MSKRQILTAAKRKGLEIVTAEYGWNPTPGEKVPSWTIQITPASADYFGITEWEMELFNTGEVLAWIDNVTPYDDVT